MCLWAQGTKRLLWPGLEERSPFLCSGECQISGSGGKSRKYRCVLSMASKRDAKGVDSSIDTNGHDVNNHSVFPLSSSFDIAKD